MQKLFKGVFLLLVTLTTISCNNDDDDTSNCQNVACTLEFVTIIVTITDQDQNPVALDSFEVTDIDTGEDRTQVLSAQELEVAQQTGVYPIISDGVLDVNQERRLRFIGFQNNQEIIISDYTVATDCCHVNLISGDPELTL